MVTIESVYEELNSVKKELNELKNMLIKIARPPLHRKIVSLKGLLKGISVKDEDIKEAKKSLFKNAGS
ncbi:MAG: hypothetical protein QMD21_07175 [Candidatus Thermoplasmatota archaeon]|nr:hypothetical protein [Candidatus Thermoplasmatota archaeon]MDI6856542.1 hypothetical protein [Candidatus Thermoplasmatota archaeon]